MLALWINVDECIRRKDFMLKQFENIKLALVLPQDHPAHIAFEDETVEGGKKHRDGSESIYEHDTFGNIIERIKYEKPKS